MKQAAALRGKPGGVHGPVQHEETNKELDTMDDVVRELGHFANDLSHDVADEDTGTAESLSLFAHGLALAIAGADKHGPEIEDLEDVDRSLRVLRDALDGLALAARDVSTVADMVQR